MLRNKTLIALVLISTLALVAVAQEPDIDYIREQVDKQFEQMRSSARRAYLGLMSYPKDVREAIFELSTYPELVVKVKILKEQKLGEHIVQPTTVFEPYPKEVQDAGKLLLFYPDILSVMQEHLAMTGLLGTVYSNDKTKVKQVFNQVAEIIEQEHEGAIDIWTERLQQNSKAVEQLTAASKAYAEQTTEPNRAPMETNFQVSKEGEVQIFDLPSSNFVMFILNNSDEYPYVSDEFLDYYDDYYYAAYRSLSYRRARPAAAYHAYQHLDDIHYGVGDWLEDRPHIQPSTLSDNYEQRIEQIREQGRFDKAFEAARQAQPDINRDQFLRKNADSFPGVTKQVKDHRLRTKNPRSRRRYQYERSQVRKKQPRSRATSRRTTSQRTRVIRGQTTKKHRVSRAQRNHQRTWQQPRTGSRGSSGRQRSGGGSGRRGR